MRVTTERFARIVAAMVLVFGFSVAATKPSLAAPLPQASAGPVFAAQGVKVRVPTSVTYAPSTGKTTVISYRTMVVNARSDGRAVMVQFEAPTGWQRVPYRYIRSAKTLVYDEALRLTLGIRSDPLGAPIPRRPGNGGEGAGGAAGADDAGNVSTNPPTGTGPVNTSDPNRPTTCDPYTQPCADMGGGTSGPPPNVTTGNTGDDGAAVGRVGGGWREEMLGSLNALRAANGAAPLSLCGNLNRSAQGWASYLASTGQFGHNLAGSTAGARIAMAGYGSNVTWGENIASGQGSVGEVMGGWAGSLGHFQNMKNPYVAHVGFGIALGGDGALYWVQNFGKGGSC